MGLSDTLIYFETHIINSIIGEAHPYYTIRQIAKDTNKHIRCVQRDIKKLKDSGVIIEHPLNNSWKTKRYRLK
jgi:hypothetical protein